MNGGKLQTIAINDIAVVDRVRPIDEEQAKAIAVSIKTNGLLNPITVRHTPNATGGKYTLVAGAHRLKAVEICGQSEIVAIIVKADKTSAQIMEIEENLIRNDLSVIDRALHVHALRELYEVENGTIKAGNPQLGQVNPIGKSKDTLTFSQYVYDRIGLSREAAKRLNRISQNLNPTLRDAIRKTPLADNQARLLKLAKMEQAEQQRFAIALRETKGDYKKSLELLHGKSLSQHQKSQADIYSKAITLLSNANDDTLNRVIEFINTLQNQKCNVVPLVK